MQGHDLGLWHVSSCSSGRPAARRRPACCCSRRPACRRHPAVTLQQQQCHAVGPSEAVHYRVLTAAAGSTHMGGVKLLPHTSSLAPGCVCGTEVLPCQLSCQLSLSCQMNRGGKGVRRGGSGVALAAAGLAGCPCSQLTQLPCVKPTTLFSAHRYQSPPSCAHLITLCAAIALATFQQHAGDGWPAVGRVPLLPSLFKAHCQACCLHQT